MLKRFIDKLYNDFEVKVLVGVEFEFYLSYDFSEELSRIIQIPLKEERGRFQYEIDIKPSSDLVKLIEEFDGIKEKIQDYAKKLDAQAIFSAKPYLDDYGSSIHVHINLLSKEGGNLFDDLKYKDLVASSLCDSMANDFLAFAPTRNCYLRYDKNYMAPTKICYGNNNRSVAIRTPDATPKRLEHRVSSSSADLYLVLYCILNSVYKGLSSKDYICDYPKIYGNAFDEQYKLKNFPQDITKAYSNFVVAHEDWI